MPLDRLFKQKCYHHLLIFHFLTCDGNSSNSNSSSRDGRNSFMVGWYKYNVDAGFHKDWNKINTGWCLHDHMERFVMIETTWKDGSCSILEGKSIVE
jgi:hypothetical protein